MRLLLFAVSRSNSIAAEELSQDVGENIADWFGPKMMNLMTMFRWNAVTHMSETVAVKPNRGNVA